jgi:hypothetical protein
VLLRVNAAGHGFGSSQATYADMAADQLAFLYDQFGLSWHEPAGVK